MYIRVGNQVYLVEAVQGDNKSFMKLVKDDMKDVLTSFSRALSPNRDKKAYDRARKRYTAMRDTFDRDLQALLKDFTEGRITKNQFAYHAKKRFTDVYPKAFQLGSSASGMDFMSLQKNDIKWLEKFKKTEYTFLNRFIDDIVKKRGRMPYDERMRMYTRTLDAVFDAGRVDAYPDEGTKIYWQMHIAEHCPDCMKLAVGSPYTPKTLPTTPRAGGTRCLSNCKCSLSIRYEPPKNLALKISKEKEILKEAINWNRIDAVMSGLIEQSLTLKTEQREYLTESMLETIQESLAGIEADPFGEDFYLLHQLGAWLLEYNETGGM